MRSLAQLTPHQQQHLAHARPTSTPLSCCSPSHPPQATGRQLSSSVQASASHTALVSTTALTNPRSSQRVHRREARRAMHAHIGMGSPSHRSTGNVAAAAAASGSESSAPLDQQVLDTSIELAHKLADAAAQITRQYFRAPFDVETKMDASPVTIADKQAETAMRELLTQHVPEHGVFGEEHGLKFGSQEGSSFMWVLDPIDGTKSFITGKPLFGTLISLLYNGVPVLGIIDQPILRERWLGVAGRPSTLNGQAIQTRPCPEISKAYLYATTPHMFEGAAETKFNRVRDAVRIPMYGCDCYAYGLLAAGHTDIVCEADLKPYDYMALVPVIKGAGGSVTDWSGKELSWRPQAGDTDLVSSWPSEVLATGDARMHDAALRLLQG